MTLPCVSVVVATYRRDELLRRCLGHLLDQQFEDPYEIVVVDDARSESTPSVIDGIRAGYAERRVPIFLLPGGRQGPATARNIGWRAATGEIIAFTDDDAFAADRFWLARGMRWFEDASVNAVGGAVIVPADEPPTDFQRNVKGLEQGEFLTCNAFYRRSALEKVGGFDERFTVPYREDTDLQYRVEALGGRMITDPDLMIIHPANRGRFGISLRLQRYSMFNALLYKKHPERYRRDIQPAPPWSYYAIVAAFVLAILALVLGAPWVAAGAAVVWAALVLQFFLRRIDGASHAPRDLLDVGVTSLLIPPLSIYWRLRGALRFRVLFV